MLLVMQDCLSRSTLMPMCGVLLALQTGCVVQDAHPAWAENVRARVPGRCF